MQETKREKEGRKIADKKYWWGCRMVIHNIGGM
jgi:hypothetical protein